MILNQGRDTRRLFVGKEMEGVLFGTPTLFVAGRVSVEQIEVAIKENTIKMVYFGADHLTCVDTDTVKTIYENYPELMITVETKHNIFQYPELEDLINADTVYWIMCFRKNSSTSYNLGTGDCLLTFLDTLVSKVDKRFRKNRFQIKFDGFSHVHLFSTEDIMSNSYEDYQGDRELTVNKHTS